MLVNAAIQSNVGDSTTKRNYKLVEPVPKNLALIFNIARPQNTKLCKLTLFILAAMWNCASLNFPL